MYRISKIGRFVAGHELPGHPKCSTPHGHNYKFEVSLQTRMINKEGMVVDFSYLKDFVKYIENRFDHQYLNEILDVPPTAENIAAEICLQFAEYIRNTQPELADNVTRYGCKVWETEDSAVEFFMVTVSVNP